MGGGGGGGGVVGPGTSNVGCHLEHCLCHTSRSETLHHQVVHVHLHSRLRRGEHINPETEVGKCFCINDHITPWGAVVGRYRVDNMLGEGEQKLVLVLGMSVRGWVCGGITWLKI